MTTLEQLGKATIKILNYSQPLELRIIRITIFYINHSYKTSS